MLATEGAFPDWPMWDQYVASFYFAITTVSTVGFGDIIPHSTGERLFVIAAMVVGGGMYGFIIASLASVVTSLDMNQKTYFDKMDMLHSYMQYRRFPLRLRHRVHRYFRKFFEINSALDEKAILNDLPEALRNDVMLLIVNESITMNYLFRSMPDSAVSRLATVFKPSDLDLNASILDPHHPVVVRRGDEGALMFVITAGSALCYRKRDDTLKSNLNNGAHGNGTGAGNRKSQRKSSSPRKESGRKAKQGSAASMFSKVLPEGGDEGRGEEKKYMESSNQGGVYDYDYEGTEEEEEEEDPNGELHCMLGPGDCFGELVALGLEDRYNATVEGAEEEFQHL
jgi:hypothetical protein